MPDLAVPVPTLKFEAPAPGLAALEKPIEVRCATANFPDGTAFDPSALGAAGFFIYRQQTAAATIQIWDESAKQWLPDPGAALASLQPKPFVFKQGEPFPWQALLVAAGQKDKNGLDQFQKAASNSNFPHYFVRAYFAGTKDTIQHLGLSAPSSALRFVSMTDAMRTGIRVGENQTPETATEVVFFLRNANQQVIGSIEIRNVGGLAQIEISNHDAGGAMVRLLPSGDIEILPAPGRSAIIAGPLDVERIFYQPADLAGTPFGPKRWLP